MQKLNSFSSPRGMLQRGRSFQLRMNTVGSALTKTSVVCASLLVLLSLVSLMSGPLLELDGPPPVPMPQENEPGGLLKPAHRRPGDRALVSTVPENIWTSKQSDYFYGCSSPVEPFPKGVSKSRSNGYLVIQTSGGLNQQRTGIIDAVVVARILNATLVVPHLDHKSYWKDSSNFSDIFDLDWFISMLARDVPIAKQLPRRLEYNEERIYSIRVPRKCKPEYFTDKVLPILQKKKVVRLTKFDYRLSNKLEINLQKLRCRVNYNALQFTPTIKDMGETLVRRLRQRSGRYIALHLRFEPDMLAFSGCYYGGGEKEQRELGAIRKRWKSLHQRSPERQRRNGKCPLTPEEVGLMLRALGFGSDSHLYVASGEVYGGERTLAPLKALFPNYYTKETLASREELHSFFGYSSRMAAVDYIVCDESDVFVTNNNGNMARILAGRRRYFGHKRTIKPNPNKLGALFLAKPNMTWDDFASKLRKAQKGFMGEPNNLGLGGGQFFENPEACICQIPKADEEDPETFYKKVNKMREEDYQRNDESDEDDELELYGELELFPEGDSSHTPESIVDGRESDTDTTEPMLPA